jgi:Protein of unknown function (DUF1176)
MPKKEYMQQEIGGSFLLYFCKLQKCKMIIKPPNNTACPSGSSPGLAGRFVLRHTLVASCWRYNFKRRATMIRQAAFAIVFAAAVLPAHAQTTIDSAAPPATSPQLVLAPPMILDMAKSAHGPNCDFEGENGPDIRYTAYELMYKAQGDAPGEAAKKGTLHEVFCNSGAYNIINVYFITLGEDSTTPVHFAVPAFNPVYENDDSEKAVLRIDIQGFTSTDNLVNPTYDAATGTMTSANKWRGVGDAGTSGTWRFLQGRFVLTHFEVDASYDGEINPTVIYDAAPETP